MNHFHQQERDFQDLKQDLGQDLMVQMVPQAQVPWIPLELIQSILLFVLSKTFKVWRRTQEVEDSCNGKDSSVAQVIHIQQSSRLSQALMDLNYTLTQSQELHHSHRERTSPVMEMYLLATSLNSVRKRTPLLESKTFLADSPWLQPTLQRFKQLAKLKSLPQIASQIEFRLNKNWMTWGTSS